MTNRKYAYQGEGRSTNRERVAEKRGEGEVAF
jgi:hypothetical protein